MIVTIRKGIKKMCDYITHLLSRIILFLKVHVIVCGYISSKTESNFVGNPAFLSNLINHTINYSVDVILRAYHSPLLDWKGTPNCWPKKEDSLLYDVHSMASNIGSKIICSLYVLSVEVSDPLFDTIPITRGGVNEWKTSLSGSKESLFNSIMSSLWLRVFVLSTLSTKTYSSISEVVENFFNFLMCVLLLL